MARFTRCPNCDQKTKLRKFALFIHVEPISPVAMGNTCRRRYRADEDAC